MKKIVPLILVLFCFMSVALNAQVPCTPNPVKFRDSASGVYPRPYQDSVPWGGIKTPACIGKSYQFIFTLKVGDTVTVQGTPIPLDSAVIAPTGAITGLPVGIGYSCNPPNCVFKKSTVGCIALKGTATAANAPGAFKPIITGKFYSVALSIFNPYSVTFPGPLFPGDYTLNLYATGDTRCNVATKDLTEVTGMVALPNPTNGKTIIHIESTVSDKFEFALTDLLGRTLQTRPLSIQAGMNTFDLDVTGLPNGVYMYSLTKGSRVLSNKLIVNQ